MENWGEEVHCCRRNPEAAVSGVSSVAWWEELCPTEAVEETHRVKGPGKLLLSGGAS